MFVPNYSRFITPTTITPQSFPDSKHLLASPGTTCPSSSLAHDDCDYQFYLPSSQVSAFWRKKRVAMIKCGRDFRAQLRTKCLPKIFGCYCRICTCSLTTIFVQIKSIARLCWLGTMGKLFLGWPKCRTNKVTALSVFDYNKILFSSNCLDILTEIFFDSPSAQHLTQIGMRK